MKTHCTDLDLIRRDQYASALRRPRVLDDIENFTPAGIVISHIVAALIDRRSRAEAEKKGRKS